MSGIALTDWAGLSLVLVGIYVLLLILFMARGGAWAGRLGPEEGAPPPIAPGILRDRLLAINALNQPFHVIEERPGRLVAEWRLTDPEWTTRDGHQRDQAGLPHLSRHRCGDADRARARKELQNRLGRQHPQDQRTRGVPAGHHLQIARWRWAPWGELRARRGTPSRTKGNAYRYNPSEIRKPLVETVIGNGWIWQPVMTFFRPIGG